MEKITKKTTIINLSFCFALIYILFFSSINTYAKEVYYTSENGVALSQEEYDFFSQLYYDGYQKYVTLEEYENLKNNGFMSAEVVSNKVYDGKARGDHHSTSSKALKIAKSCTDNECIIVVSLEWLVNPTVRSYDVMGAYFHNVTLSKPIISTRLAGNTAASFFDCNRIESNGIGTSVLLTNDSNLNLTQTFYTTKGGKIYASYQHARSKTTLAISKKYNFSVIGAGNVFDFYGEAYDVYDLMNGVNIEV